MPVHEADLLSSLLLGASAAVMMAPGAHAARPDLSVATVIAPPAQAAGGTTLALSGRVRNSGTARARRSTVRFLLSTDTRAGAGGYAAFNAGGSTGQAADRLGI